MRATICSISDQDWYVTRSYGHYHIPACPKGQPYILVFVDDAADQYSLGDNKWAQVLVKGEDIARDIVGYHDPANTLEKEGVFVCATNTPAPEELQKAHEMRNAWFHQAVQQGDSIYARAHDPRLVPDYSRRAAMALGEERPWVYRVQKKLPCPACGEPVVEGVAICKSCNAILDRNKAREFGLLPPELRSPRVRESGPQPDPVAGTQREHR